MSKYKESISSIMSTKEEVKMLVFGLTVIAGGLSVLEVVMTIIDEKERKKHAIIFTIEFLLSLVGAFILVFTYDIPSPAIERKNDYSAIELSCDKGFSIEYRLSAGSDDKWIKYIKPIKIEKNTILYARTVFLFLKSEEESKDIFVAENGLTKQVMRWRMGRNGKRYSDRGTPQACAAVEEIYYSVTSVIFSGADSDVRCSVCTGSGTEPVCAGIDRAVGNFTAATGGNGREIPELGSRKRRNRRWENFRW